MALLNLLLQIAVWRQIASPQTAGHGMLRVHAARAQRRLKHQRKGPTIHTWDLGIQWIPIYWSAMEKMMWSSEHQLCCQLQICWPCCFLAIYMHVQPYCQVLHRHRHRAMESPTRVKRHCHIHTRLRKKRDHRILRCLRRIVSGATQVHCVGGASAGWSQVCGSQQQQVGPLLQVALFLMHSQHLWLALQVQPRRTLCLRTVIGKRGSKGSIINYSIDTEHIWQKGIQRGSSEGPSTG